MFTQLCEQQDPVSGVWYCTRPRGHEGDHIASIGPYTEHATVIMRWPSVRADARTPDVDAAGSPSSPGVE